MEDCCEEMRKAKENEIFVLDESIQKVVLLAQRCAEYIVFYCPFCGQKLRRNNGNN